MQFKIDSRGDSFALEAAILIYRNKGSDQAYATKHTVGCESSSGRAVIRPGSPLTESDYQYLVDGLKPQDRPAMVWADPRVLARGMGRLLWWEPSGVRALFFKLSSHVSGTFDGFGSCPLPGMVFLSMDNQLYVYAFKGKTAPTRQTPLYQAPLFNVWANGQVCSGNVVLPEAAEHSDPQVWERFLFESNFTHPNISAKDRLMLGVNPISFWKKQIQKPTATFPEKVLVDIGLKVEDLMAPNLKSKWSGMTALGAFR